MSKNKKIQTGITLSAIILAIIIIVSIRSYMEKIAIENQIALPVLEAQTKTATQDGNGNEVPTTSDKPKLTQIICEMDLPMPQINLQIDELPALQKWASLSYMKTMPNELDLTELDDKIKNIPIHIHTEDVTSENIEFARSLVKDLVLCYSGKSFSKYLEIRSGAEALCTEKDSVYAKKKYQELLQSIETNFPPGTKKPGNLLEAASIVWEFIYSQKPYMDKVSFDLSFIAFYTQNEDEFQEDKWQPEVKGFPNALQEEAVKLGSLTSGNRHRMFENKTSPVSVFHRDKKIKFFDVLISTGRDEIAPFPIMFRYYYDPTSNKWLRAFFAEFYNKPKAFRPLL